MMNGYERIMTAIKLEKPDKVPIAEFVIDKNVYRHFFPNAQSQVELEIAWNLDAVSCGVVFLSQKDFGGGRFIDEWGVTYQRNSEQIAHPVQGCISSRDDLLHYRAPDAMHPERLGRLPELVARYKGEKAIVFHQRAAFMWSCYLMGMDNLLMNFVLEPQLCHDLMDLVLSVNIQIARRAIQAGADIIVLGDDYAHNQGPLMSPALFREFILPRLKQMVDVIHEEGALVVKHTDGNIMKIIDDIVDTGIDGLNPLEPVPGMDLGEIKKKYGRRVSLWGNIDCGDLLPYGNRQQVIDAVRRCINMAAGDGGFILTSSNSIHSSVNPENYRVMVETAQACKVY